jgi:Na+/proline symporter
LTQIGGDLAAVGPYIVSHIGLPLGIVLLYVLVILAACYSTIDGGSAAMASVVSVDIVKKINPNIPEKKLFVITKLATLIGGVIATIIVLSGVDFTTLVLTTYALKTAILLPIILAIAWPRTNTIGFVGGVVLSILIGMPLRHVYGELVGTLTILAVSAVVVWLGAMIKPETFDMNSLKLVKDELEEGRREPVAAYEGPVPAIPVR